MVFRVGTNFGVFVVLGLATACGGGSHSSEPGSPAAGNGGDTSSSAGAGAGGLAAAGFDAGGAAAAGTSAAGALNGGSDAGGADDAGADSGGTENGGGAGLSNGAASGSGAGGGSGAAGGSPIDIGPQQTSDKLDVLFVVDNSASMADKQNILEASLPHFVNRLVNPACVDAQGKQTAQQPASGSAPCTTGKREFTPVSDLHLGVITTSIGGHGGAICATTPTSVDQLDDEAELIPAQRDNVASYQNSGFLSFDATGKAGLTDASAVVGNLQAMVSAAGEHGCGFEAPLEAMYRFLVDPEPPVSVDLVNNQSTPTGLNDTLLTQRAAFLRPDSSVAIVILSDESDCSVIDSDVGWFIGSSTHMPRATAACDTSVNDPCCRSCSSIEPAPPTGCLPLDQDSVCQTVASGDKYATWDQLHDAANLRCFNQRQRFGFDLLYPVDRYTNALSNPQIASRAGTLVDNPLLAARAGKGPRSATLISISTIVGVPWQDLATANSLTAGQPLQYLNGAGLASNGRWPILLGDPKRDLPPSDPFMRESVEPRSGKNPLTQAPIVAADSLNPVQSPINGHEQNIVNLDDLQYACSFLLSTPHVCQGGDPDCDCSPDKQGGLASVTSYNSPLCQPPLGGVPSATQYYGKGYPGARELAFAQGMGDRAVPGSICPKTLSDAASPDYAYTPALNALIGRIASTLK